MGVLHQTWVLTKKNLLVVLRRHWFSTIFRALVLPIVYIFIISYVRNFFLPPAVYGIGAPRPIRDPVDAFETQSGRSRVVLINNGLTGGLVEDAISDLNTTYSTAGADVQFASTDDDLATLCRSSLSGTSRCYGAVSFTGSPTEGQSTTWAYTVYVDFGLGLRINVDSNDDDTRLYVLPLIHAIDSSIARASGMELPQTMEEFPFTFETLQQREDRVQRLFMGALVRYLGLVVFIAVCGITYHLPGHVARERELGMSSLIDTMNPQKRQWLSHMARILATNTSFSLIYLPGFIGVAGVIAGLMFYRTSAGMQVLFHILMCMSLASSSNFAASSFPRAQLSGITIVIVSCLLAVIAQWAVPPIAPAIAVLSVLLPPVNYTMYTLYVASFEQRIRGASFGGALRYSSVSNLPGWFYFVAAVVQIVGFPLLSLLVEGVLYGTMSKRRKMSKDMSQAPYAIRLVDFAKSYKPGFWSRVAFWKKSETVHAVNGVTFNANRGQLVSMLGKNGAGKSTSMAAITGQEKVEVGFIELDGNGGLGFCPQKNVLWGELTVLEHVRIFNQLKAGRRSASRKDLHTSIAACDLAAKTDAKSRTLSGGQKRKLQLAIAFTGGSQVCCVDEASSGLDPVSRRKIWNILLAERGHRTILFTTHALDEADALSDHILILEKGKLTLEGSAVELKQRYGGDYQIIVPEHTAVEVPRNVEAKQVSTGTGTSFLISDPAHVGRFVAHLDKMGIQDYEVNGPTIEQVFLRQADSTTTHITNSTKQEGPGGATNRLSGSTPVQEDQPDLPESRPIGFFGQVWALYRKRLAILPRNYLPYIFALLIPILTAYLATSFLSGYRLLICSPAALASGPQTVEIPSLGLFIGRNVPVGPRGEFNVEQLDSLFGGGGVVQQGLRQFSTYEEWNLYIQQNYLRISPGGLFLGNGTSNTPTIAYLADEGLARPAAVKSVSDSYLLNMPISSSFSTFALPLPGSTGDSLQLCIYFGLALAIMPGLFALYPSYERTRMIKALQYSNGVLPGPLWLAHLLFDAFFVLGISVVTLVIFITVRSDAWFSAGHLWPVFFFFGLSSTLFSYVISLFVRTQLGAFAFAAGYQAITLLLYFFIYLILVGFSQADSLQANLNTVQFTFGLITPSGNLLRALLLTLNQSQIVCIGQAFRDPGSMSVYGGPICYLVLQTVLLYAFLVSYDSSYFGQLRAWLVAKLHRNNKVKDTESTEKYYPPADVMAETVRTEHSPQDALRALHLSKAFRRDDKVVDDLTFGVGSSEVFACLGPNGAGKTTTISLIRGNLKPTHNPSQMTDIQIAGNSLLHSRRATLLSLGVCPQFDAIDHLTVTQHLSFYARFAGIPRRSIKVVVTHILAAVGLTEYANRKAATLSGGNKRKLSLAIAVVGNPKVLLLDEPSSGMDAVSRRVMWRALEAVKHLGKDKSMAMVITSHSMEEVAALADRVGIMRGKMLAVGTKRDLIQRFGDRWHVHLILRQDVVGNRAAEERMRRWVEEEVEGARVERELLCGQLRFWVPRSTEGGLARVFEMLERRKGELGIEYYSVVQTGLEDVFLNVVGQEEE